MVLENAKTEQSNATETVQIYFREFNDQKAYNDYTDATDLCTDKINLFQDESSWTDFKLEFSEIGKMKRSNMFHLPYKPFGLSYFMALSVQVIEANREVLVRR